MVLVDADLLKEDCIVEFDEFVAQVGNLGPEFLVLFGAGPCSDLVMSGSVAFIVQLVAELVLARSQFRYLAP